jgi:hypothetical protein
VLREDDVMQVEDFKFNDNPKGNDRPEEQTLTVRVINYNAVNRGSLIAFFDVKIVEHGIVYRSMRHAVMNGKEVVQVPSKFISTGDGGKKPMRIIDFENPLDFLRFQEAVLREIRRHKETMENNSYAREQHTGQARQAH